MKVVLQRASQASVTVEGIIRGQIEHGLVILLCIEQNDSIAECDFLARKCVELRIFSDDEGKMNKSIADIGGSVLLISQFTLAADWKKGRRPGFSKAADPQTGKRLYEYFGQAIEKAGIPVQTGVFGADMAVNLTNDGPVTLILDHQEAQAISL